MVTEVIEDLKLLEQNTDAQMLFGGKGGKLQVHFDSFLVDSILFVLLLSRDMKSRTFMIICTALSLVYYL